MKHSAILTVLIIPLFTCSLHANVQLRQIHLKFEDLAGHLNCPIITAPQILKILNSNKVMLIDVRPKVERDASMLPQAISIEEFTKKNQKFTDRILIAYYTIGYRSGLFAEKHKERKIYNLKGGVLAWSHYNGKFIKNNKETNQVHIFSKEWNLLNSNYQAVSN